ncbi:MAG: hypothetical protein WDZ28_02215 [Simkaniaceae bacterium]
MTTYMASVPSGILGWNIAIGVCIGVLFSLLLIGFDTLFRKFNLRSFNVAIIGVLIGYLMGLALVLIFNAVLDVSSIPLALNPQTLEIIKIALFLFGIYLGTIMTLRSSDELYVSIPFVKFTPTAQKKKDILIDVSVLEDTRIIDLCTTGLLDHQLILPRFIVKDIYSQIESENEIDRQKAKRALDTVKKLEAASSLHLRYNDTDFPEVHEVSAKLIRLARLLESNVLTADITRVQMGTIEGILIINLHSLSNALKPLMQAGQYIHIKIQRYGKEPRQGVGYLEDGTMVVVNGGGNYISQTIEAQVLSVKHTSSGRMIFCNAPDSDQADYTESGYDDEEET